MPRKYYGVKNGHQPGVYETWEDCKKQVHGFSGASFKGFPTRREAELFCGLTDEEEAAQIPKQAKEEVVKTDCIPSSPDAEAIAYVDGSYDNSAKAFAYGVVLFHNGREEHFSGKMNDPELIEMRNVAGEIKAAEAAMQYCLDHDIRSIHIYHDYEGIAKWCTGEWKANKVGTKAYQAFYLGIQSALQVRFIKVKGHSGDQYNDIADQLAKSALGIGVQPKCKASDSGK